MIQLLQPVKVRFWCLRYDIRYLRVVSLKILMDPGTLQSLNKMIFLLLFHSQSFTDNFKDVRARNTKSALI